MARLLLSGPAGAAKSQRARRWRLAQIEPAIIADFQALYAALTGDSRGEDGRYPLRDNRLLPTVEYVRRAAITAARERDLSIVATNADGSPERRAFLLQQLGSDAIEEIVDPGRSVVSARLADSETGIVSPECDVAIQRWYARLG